MAEFHKVPFGKNHFRRAATTDPDQQGSVCMLNDADSYQGGGSAGDEPREKLNDAEALFSQLKR